MKQSGSTRWGNNRFGKGLLLGPCAFATLTAVMRSLIGAARSGQVMSMRLPLRRHSGHQPRFERNGLETLFLRHEDSRNVGTVARCSTLLSHGWTLTRRCRLPSRSVRFLDQQPWTRHGVVGPDRLALPPCTAEIKLRHFLDLGNCRGASKADLLVMAAVHEPVADQSSASIRFQRCSDDIAAGDQVFDRAGAERVLA